MEKPQIDDYIMRTGYRHFLRDWCYWKIDIDPEAAEESDAALPSSVRQVLDGEDLTPAQIEALILELDLPKRESNVFRDLVTYDQGRAELGILQERFERLVGLSQGESRSAVRMKDEAEKTRKQLTELHWWVVDARERMFMAISERHRRRLDSLFNPITGDLPFGIVRAMSTSPDFQYDSAWIYSKLLFPFPQPLVQHVLRILEGSGLLGQQQNGPSLDKTMRQVDAVLYFRRTIDYGKDILLRFLEDQNAKTLGHVNFRTVTIAVPEEVIPHINQIFDETFDQVTTVIQEHDGPPDRVYQLQLHLFPVTKRLGTRQ